MKLRIGADSALYAAARFVNCVSPPYGGIVTPRRIEMAGGLSTVVRSVCHPVHGRIGSTSMCVCRSRLRATE